MQDVQKIKPIKTVFRQTDECNQLHLSGNFFIKVPYKKPAFFDCLRSECYNVFTTNNQHKEAKRWARLLERPR